MKNLAVFASGSGSNFEAIAGAVASGELKVNLKFLFCDKKNAYALERAKKFGIKTYAFELKEFENKQKFEEKIVEICNEEQIDMIALAGYMKIVSETLLLAYENKIINIHPSLLPSFKGAHGIADAYNYGVKVFGVSIHYVSSELDGGKIISQQSFPHTEGERVEEVEERIHKIEHKLYPQTLKNLLEEKI
ncbi:MAG: phosphoribosylglycinamide formyltransferase [Bacillota bacterium]